MQKEGSRELIDAIITAWSKRYSPIPSFQPGVLLLVEREDRNLKPLKAAKHCFGINHIIVEAVLGTTLDWAYRPIQFAFRHQLRTRSIIITSRTAAEGEILWYFNQSNSLKQADSAEQVDSGLIERVSCGTRYKNHVYQRNHYYLLLSIVVLRCCCQRAETPVPPFAALFSTANPPNYTDITRFRSPNTKHRVKQNKGPTALHK